MERACILLFTLAAANVMMAQAPGVPVYSPLDRMFERERQNVTRDIIAYLRTKTDQDLGGDPNAWIQKYGRK